MYQTNPAFSVHIHAPYIGIKMATMPQNQRGFTFDPGGRTIDTTTLNDQQYTNTARQKTIKSTIYDAQRPYTTTLTITCYLDEQLSRRNNTKPASSASTYETPYRNLSNLRQPILMTLMIYLDSTKSTHLSLADQDLSIQTSILYGL